jgi:hypothetical protein
MGTLKYGDTEYYESHGNTLISRFGITRPQGKEIGEKIRLSFLSDSPCWELDPAWADPDMVQCRKIQIGRRIHKIFTPESMLMLGSVLVFVVSIVFPRCHWPITFRKWKAGLRCAYHYSVLVPVNIMKYTSHYCVYTRKF